MNANPRLQRNGRANQRTYSAERLKELMKAAGNIAAEGTQRMIEREKAYQSKG